MSHKISKTGKRTAMVAAIFVFLIAAFLIFSKTEPLKTSGVGRVFRLILGTPLAAQDMEDLESAILKQNVNTLRDWASSVVQKYNSNKSQFTKSSEMWVKGDLVFSKSETPDWVKKNWSYSEYGIAPTPSIMLDDQGVPECVMYEWYLKGVAISVKNDSDPVVLNFAWRVKEVAKGIYVYAVEK
jgi:hypothetical protein